MMSMQLVIVINIKMQTNEAMLCTKQQAMSFVLVVKKCWQFKIYVQSKFDGLMNLRPDNAPTLTNNKSTFLTYRLKHIHVSFSKVKFRTMS